MSYAVTARSRVWTHMAGCVHSELEETEIACACLFIGGCVRRIFYPGAKFSYALYS